MATIHGKGAAIWVDEVNASGYANSWTLNITADVAETTVFNDAAKTFLEGDYSWTIDITSLFDTTDGGWDEATADDILTNGGTRYVMLGPQGDAAGDIVYETQALYTAKVIPTDLQNAVGINLSAQGTATAGAFGGIARGMVILNATITGTGAQTGQNIGAIAASTYSVATYRISSITGTIAMSHEESTDDGSGDAYAAVANLASGSLSAAGVTQKTDTAGIEAWRRVNVTSAPTTAGVLVTSTEGI